MRRFGKTTMARARLIKRKSHQSGCGRIKWFGAGVFICRRFACVALIDWLSPLWRHSPPCWLALPRCPRQPREAAPEAAWQLRVALVAAHISVAPCLAPDTRCSPVVRALGLAESATVAAQGTVGPYGDIDPDWAGVSGHLSPIRPMIASFAGIGFASASGGIVVGIWCGASHGVGSATKRLTVLTLQG